MNVSIVSPGPKATPNKGVLTTVIERGHHPLQYEQDGRRGHIAVFLQYRIAVVQVAVGKCQAFINGL